MAHDLDHDGGLGSAISSAPSRNAPGKSSLTAALQRRAAGSTPPPGEAQARPRWHDADAVSDRPYLDTLLAPVQRQADAAVAVQRTPTAGPSAEDRGHPDAAALPPRAVAGVNVRGRIMGREVQGNRTRLTIGLGPTQGVWVGMHGHLLNEAGQPWHRFTIEDIVGGFSIAYVDEAHQDTLMKAKGVVVNPTGGADGAAAKRTPVQRHADGHTGQDESQVHATAARGIAGSGGSLPYLDVIQRAFGPHDVSGIVAHTDGEAAGAARAIGASAYAAGNHVAFAGTPDLHTAAHEAAHVVQQRAGVHLKGGVGQVGDPYEVHADAVADAVVRGESAATLLDSVGEAGGASTVDVQRKEDPAAREWREQSLRIWGSPLWHIPADRGGFWHKGMNEVGRAELDDRFGQHDSARQHREEALRTPELTQHWVSLATPANLAADALGDHVHIQKALGFSGVSDLSSGLTSSDKGRVAEDLDVAERSIRHHQDDLNVAISTALAAQKKFIGVGQQLNAAVAGRARRSMADKLRDKEAERAAINQHVKDAALAGKRVQAVVELAVSVFSFDAAGAAKTAKSVTAVGKSAGDATFGTPGLIGGLVEWFASRKYKERLGEIDLEINALSKDVAMAEAFEDASRLRGLVTELEGTYHALAAAVEAMALRARTLRDVMRSPPKRQKHTEGAKPGPTAEEAAAQADAADPAKRVEIFVTSALATSALLGGGMRAVGPVLSFFGQRMQEMHNSGIGDHQFLSEQTRFVSLWYQEASRQKDAVDAEGAQIPALKGRKP